MAEGADGFHMLHVGFLSRIRRSVARRVVGDHPEDASAHVPNPDQKAGADQGTPAANLFLLCDEPRRPRPDAFPLSREYNDGPSMVALAERLARDERRDGPLHEPRIHAPPDSRGDSLPLGGAAPRSAHPFADNP